MKLGLVLAGGGARGAYQIGVWKALNELKIDKYIEVISGTSIGALNSILIKQEDIDIAEELWAELNNDTVFPTDEMDMLRRSILLTIGSKSLDFIKRYIPKTIVGGDVPRDATIELFDKYLDISKIKDKNKICYITCTEVPNLEVKYFKINDYNEENIKKIILATSALPMIYKSEEIEGANYLDGGIVDNLPIQPVYGEGCDIIIVNPLSSDAIIDEDLYPEAKIIEIRPSEIESGFIDGALDFSKNSINKRMRMGYYDTMSQISPIMDIAFHIFNDEKRNKSIKYKVVSYFKKVFK